jgi:hypothetical protein
LQLKRPEMMSQQWFFDWDNAHVHTDAVVSSWFDAHGVQWLEHVPYSPILAPTDFVLLKKAKMGAGMPEPGPGQLQERLGGGRHTSDRRRLRRCLQKLGGALQKAHPPRRQVRRKILRNKHTPSSNRCHFNYTFAFVCIHTSYIYKIQASLRSNSRYCRQFT